MEEAGIVCVFYLLVIFFWYLMCFLVIDLEQEFVIEIVSTAIVEIIAIIIIIIKKNPLFNHDFHESTKTRSSFHVFCLFGCK